MEIEQTLRDGISVLSRSWPLVLATTAVICSGWGLNLFLFLKNTADKTITRRSVWLPGFFFAVSLILRLTFLTRIFVPPYFDSAEHYRIVTELVTAQRTSTLMERLPTLTPVYYHLGFHFLVSLLTLGLHANPMDVIQVLGQVILAAIPIPLFFLILKETRSAFAAFFALLLAGFGWYMPGFAVNWGKYPALAGLLAVEYVLILAFFLNWKKTKDHHPALIGLLVLGSLVAAFFHTRTLVIIAACLISRSLARKLDSLPKILRNASLGMIFAGMLIFGTAIHANPLLRLALDPYLGTGVWITSIVFLLLPFALSHFPHGSYFSLLFILCLFLVLFVPAGVHSPGLEDQTLLDRPFVEMSLYLPLSLLGGLGLAGLLHALRDIRFLSASMRFPFQIFIPVLLASFAGVLSIGRYDFYPSDCCNLMGYDDTIALDWIEENLPSDALILVAAAPLKVLPTGPSTNLAGTDAGIWIPALTGRRIVLASFESDFRSQDILERLCPMQIGYIYASGRKQSFTSAQFLGKTEWYKRILFLPKAQIYQLAGCSQ